MRELSLTKVSGLSPFSKSKTLSLFFQDLLVAMAGTLKGKIYLCANVTGVSYGVSSNTIYFQTETGGNQTVECSAIIITFPPTEKAMKIFTPPDSALALTALTIQVKTSNYYTLLLADPNSNFGDKVTAFYHVPLSSVPDNPAVNLLYIKQFSTPTSSVTAYYLTPSLKTADQARTESLASYSKFVHRTDVNASSIVQDFNQWAYFPHVSKESLDAGFYLAFEALQGVSRQYYTGGLFNFETVQNSMEHARYIIGTYF